MGNSKTMMIIILAVLVVLIGAIVAGVLLITSSINNAIAAEPQIVTEAIFAPEALGEADIRPFQLTSGGITTNLLTSPSETNRFVRLESPAIGINNLDPDEAEEFILMIADREIIIVDIITGILRRSTAEQLNSLGGVDVLREEILISLQQAFNTHLIVRVYFGLIVQ